MVGTHVEAAATREGETALATVGVRQIKTSLTAFSARSGPPLRNCASPNREAGFLPAASISVQQGMEMLSAHDSWDLRVGY